MTEHIGGEEDFGALARRLRLAAGLTHRGAALKIGVSTGTVLRLERGYAPLLSTALKVLRFYGETATIGWDPPATQREEK